MDSRLTELFEQEREKVFQGLMEIWTELEVPAAQKALYVDVDTPSTPVVVEQLILEDGE